MDSTFEKEGFSQKYLNFKECTIAFDTFETLSIAVPKGFRLKRIKSEGSCEYRFAYKDSSTFYVTSDVWFGSRLNLENRHLSGHASYHKEALNDTIRIGGITSNGKYWAESIVGNFTIGYINATKEKKEEFSKIEDSIVLN